MKNRQEVPLSLPMQCNPKQNDSLLNPLKSLGLEWCNSVLNSLSLGGDYHGTEYQYSGMNKTDLIRPLPEDIASRKDRRRRKMFHDASDFC